MKEYSTTTSAYPLCFGPIAAAGVGVHSNGKRASSSRRAVAYSIEHTPSTMELEGNDENETMLDKALDGDYNAGFFRAIAASLRGGAALKQGIRAVGQARPLAFASEGGVAAKSMIPKYVYYGAWGLSGVAILADIATKTMDAPQEKRKATTAYWAIFHIPASLVIPAAIIHQVVHVAEKGVNSKAVEKLALAPRTKALIPVAAALLAIIPVVPVVDHFSELLLEPTLGSLVGLSADDFAQYHHHDVDEEDSKAHKE